MPKKNKTTKPENFEQKNYMTIDPEDVKLAVEVPVKRKPTREQLETIETVGNKLDSVIKKPKRTRSVASSTVKKTRAPTKTRSTTKTATRSSGKTEKKLIGISSRTHTMDLDPNGYVLIITEKPQAAAKIAAALAEGSEKQISKNGVSHYEFKRNGKKIVVACAVGHLFTVSQTEKGTHYPIFEIDWYPNYEIKKKDFTRKYYQLIERLAKGASEVVVATDFDVEGEVIGYNIVRFIARQNDARRMKFSSLTAKELQDAYDNSNPTIEWGQAIAGETRHFVDWLYGINLSRALMNSIKSTGRFKIMSIGRVQGPALNMIVEKEKEILAFVPSPYWQVFATINDGKNTTELKYVKDLIKQSDLEKFEKLEGTKAIANTTKTKDSLMPPTPFDLTTLQTEAYKFHSITPSQALAIAQKLYLAGLISYPRTSSQKIPESMEPKKILKKLGSHYPETQFAKRDTPVEGKKTDPAHPAIIPTGQYQKLEDQEKKLYELIVKRFISLYCENAEIENKKVEINVDGLKFNEKGMEIAKQGNNILGKNA